MYAHTDTDTDRQSEKTAEDTTFNMYANALALTHRSIGPKHLSQEAAGPP